MNTKTFIKNIDTPPSREYKFHALAQTLSHIRMSRSLADRALRDHGLSLDDIRLPGNTTFHATKKSGSFRHIPSPEKSSKNTSIESHIDTNKEPDIELPSSSIEELTAAIAQVYYNSTPFKKRREVFLREPGSSQEKIDGILHDLSMKLSIELVNTFRDSMSAHAQESYAMLPDTADRFVTLRMQYYTHDNHLSLQKNESGYIVHAPNFFSSDALQSIDRIMLTQQSIATSKMKHEQSHGTTSDPKHLDTEQIDKLYGELGNM